MLLLKYLVRSNYLGMSSSMVLAWGPRVLDPSGLNPSPGKDDASNSCKLDEKNLNPLLSKTATMCIIVF
jgi:hypothetical protein